MHSEKTREQSSADFVKTVTASAEGGATLDDVRLGAFLVDLSG